MISKKRLVLISVLTILLVVGGLYATYAINVFEEEVTPEEYDMAFNFDLSGSVTREMTVEAGKIKVFDLDITNPYSDTIQYGVAYSLVSPATLPIGVTIAESSLSKNSAVGMIDANKTLSISIIVVNESSSSVTLSFSVINGYKNGGDLIVEDGKVLIEESYEVGPPPPARLTSAEVLENLGLTSLLKTVTPDFTQAATTDEGIYAAEDDLGTSYYFRGASTRNYVKFGKWSNNAPGVYYGYYSANSTDYHEYDSLSACQEGDDMGHYNVNCTFIPRAGKDMYWRIIRINGDGTIRMIYDGTTPHSNGESTADRSVIASESENGVFSQSISSNGSVGYMYGSTLGSTYELEHSNDLNSKMKNYLENTWYATNLKNTEYERYIADAIYCNDRSVYSGTGIGTTVTYYEVYQRVYNDKLPILTCSQLNDRFTMNNSTIETTDKKGTNKKLEAPVGLITADELAMAGAVSIIDNAQFYLYMGWDYWTISPAYMDIYTSSIIGAKISREYVEFGITGIQSYYEFAAVHPVISLKADALKYDAETSNGTMEHPFVVG